MEDAAALGPVADEVTVALPWGPLLDGVLGGRPDVLAAIAALVRPGGRVRVVVSATPRDGREPPSVGDLRAAYAAAGLRLSCARAATRADVVAAGSTWGKRLGAGARRPALLIEARRA